MAGMSRRFAEAGYQVPKYMLPLNGKSIFHHSVSGFSRYFDSDLFVFVCREESQTVHFIEREAKSLGIRKFEIVCLPAPTAGQAETVYLGIKNISQDEDLYIFNIDTFRPLFLKPKMEKVADGFLETFVGTGKNWSNVLGDAEGRVIRTAEKEELSEYCCTGLYYFKSVHNFCEAFEFAKSTKSTVKGEYYVAPLYNHLINLAKDVRFTIIARDEVVFCGVPEEFIELGGALASEL